MSLSTSIRGIFFAFHHVLDFISVDVGTFHLAATKQTFSFFTRRIHISIYRDLVHDFIRKDGHQFLLLQNR